MPIDICILFGQNHVTFDLGHSCTFYVKFYTRYALIDSYINHLKSELKNISWIHVYDIPVVIEQMAATNCLLSKSGVLNLLDKIL